MATYLELLGVSQDETLNKKVRVAVIIAAEAIRTDGTPPTNQAQRLLWAKSVFENPDAEAKRMVWAVLAANKDATTAQITGATDALVQTNVDAAVDVFAGT